MIEAGEIGLEDSASIASRKLRIAFLGGAYDSAVGRVHRIAVEMDQRFELVAGCFSRKDETNRSSALKYGIRPERAYSSLDKLIDEEVGKIDAIVILTPTDQHVNQLVTCIDAGLPVICEKALVTTSDEATIVVDRLAMRDGFLAVTYNYTGYPMLRELKHMIAAGRLGKIQQVHMEMPQEGFARVGDNGTPMVPQAWRLRDGRIPTISLDLGVHLHMMVRFLTNERPEEVVATGNSYGNFKQIVDNVSCLARYSGDLDCSIWYSKTALGYRNGLKVRVFGECGAAEWVQENPEYLQLADRSGGRFVIDRGSNDIRISNQPRYTRFKVGHPAGFIEAFSNYYYDTADVLEQYLADNVVRRHQYVFGIDDALEGLRMLEAIARSSISKCWEKVA